jgi:hypothetical protein
MLQDNNTPPAVRRSPSLNAGKTQRPHLFTQLPTELQTMIICYFRPKRRDHRRTLCALARVNRALNALAVPQLYSRVTPRAFPALLRRPTLAGLVKEIYNPPNESQVKSMRADLAVNGLLPAHSTWDSDDEEEAQSSEGASESDGEHTVIRSKVSGDYFLYIDFERHSSVRAASGRFNWFSVFPA